MRLARIAPRTIPITVAPAIAMSETSTVRQRPSASVPRLSQITAQSNAASQVMSTRERPRLPRPLPGQYVLRARAVGRQVLADGVLERRLALTRHVVVERRPEPLRHVRVEDPHELVAALHVVDRRVHPLVHRRVALADADAPRD